MINLINFILTKYMGVLKKIYFLLIISYSFNTFISANEDETEFVDEEDITDDDDDEIDGDDEDFTDDDDNEIDNDIEYDDSDNNYNDDEFIDNDSDYDENEDNYNENNTKNNNEINGNNLDEEDIDEKIERMKNRIEKREEESKKKFFESYNRLRRDVQILKARDPYRGKKDGLANLDASYKKFRIVNFGLYGYSNISRFFKYALGNSNPKVTRMVKKYVPTNPGDVPKNIYRQYLLSAGLCLNINIDSGGLSLVGGYCIFEDTYIWDTVDTYVGFNFDVLFRFPAIQIVDLAFNIIDPLGILLYFTGFRRRTEWFVGVKCYFYESKDIGKFDPGFKNNVFTDLNNLKNDKSKSTVEKASELLFKYCTIGRRVYINQHIFYSFTSSILFPVILIWLSKDCKQVGKFLTDCKFVDSIINVSLGILI